MIKEVSKGAGAYMGLSTDAKPAGTGGAAGGYAGEPENMTLFIEMDTGNTYYYNRATHVWALMG